jgi:hypothetical protein
MRDIKVLHLEPTDVCQAACPLCSRETDILFDKTRQHHLSMEDILRVFNVGQISQLDKMFMCGNYGDPAAGKYTLDIYKKFRQLNPHIVLGMNTNGALRNAKWWHRLGNIFNQPKDYTVFSIDGLEDTNSIYRVNVNWDQLMHNVRSFIAAGGSAHWDMLVYKHNEHQIDQCRQLAKDMGFTWFRAKISKRPFINGLSAPVSWQPTVVSPGSIDCHALRDQSIYINSQGKLIPCCWLGADRQSDGISLQHVSSTWKSKNPYPVCKQTCSSISGHTVFANQWKIEEKLC